MIIAASLLYNLDIDESFDPTKRMAVPKTAKGEIEICAMRVL